ncbi:MAG: Conserved repeat domain protein, partial [Verrucomicrobiales bacterium]|nr:Conserved repeat domain protein [Verrucomicrobiales bacterium]
FGPYLTTTEIYDPARTRIPPTLSISDASTVERNSGSSNLLFTVSLSSAMGVPVTVNFATASLTAVAGEDFLDTNGTLLFAPGVTNQTISVAVLGDVNYEADETFSVSLSSPTNVLLDLARASATGTILNDDVPPGISIAPVSGYEGNMGTTNISLNLSLSASSYQTITVNYSTVDGTASAGSDYVATNGVVTFPPGTTNQTIAMVVSGDLQVEPNETFIVQLSNATNATLSVSSAVATILDDDGAAGFIHHFEIVLPPGAIYATGPTPFTINARDFGGGIATNFSGRVLLMVGFGDEAPQHFGFEDGQLGDWTPTYGGTQPGPYEIKYFNVTASNEFSMAFRTAAGHGTDGIVRQVPLTGGRRYFVTGDFAESSEGGGSNSGDTVANLILNNFTLGQYHFGGVNGGQVLRTNLGGYFDAPASATYPLALLFTRDPWSETYPIGAFADEIVIGAASITPRFTAHFTNGLWSGTHAIGAPGTNYVLFAKDLEGHVGNSSVFAVQPVGDVVLRTVVTPTTPRVGSNVVVTLNMTNLGPATASGVVVTNRLPPEFQFVSATSVSGACTVSNGVVFCNVGDLALNQTASVTITMRPVTFGTVTNFAGAWPIGFDAQPTNNTSTTNIAISPALIFVSDVTVMEATNSTTNAVFTVTVGDPHTDTITVNYATADVSATAGVDYITASGQLTFAPGVSTQTVSVVVLDDTLAELTETFRLQLSSPVNAALAGTGYGTASILDNGDPWPQISINDIAIGEGDIGSVSAVFTVTFDRPAGSAITLTYSTTNGTAVSTNDYTGVTNASVTFSAGQTNRTLTVFVRGDTVNEPDETFTVGLGLSANNPNSGTFTKRIGTCTIVNDDAVPGRLDHFAWNVSSPQVANLPFAASLMAQDAFNNVVTNTLPSIPLSASFGTNGIKTTLTPTSATGFTNSVWNGLLTLTATNSPIVLVASDAQGHIGTSIPISVLPPITTSLLLPASVTEGDGVLVNGGTLTVGTARGVNTTFALSSSDTTELIVPTNLVLLAGQTNVSFNVTVVDDAILDGTHNATITASTAGYVTSAVAVPVHDNETASLSVSATANVSESAGTVTGTVTISSPPGDSVQVYLISSDTTEIQVPSSITFTTGQTSKTFSITVVNDIELDGPQTARITAHVQNWTDAFADVAVADDDTNTVFVAFSAPGATFFEGSGAVSNAIVRLGGTVTSNVTVSLTSSMPSKLSVAASVVVPAGSNSVLLPITVPDDSVFDGTQIVTITASAAGFFSIPTNVTVADNDLHHFSFSPIPPTVEATIPLSLTVYAKDINDVTISNFSGTISFTASNSAGVVPLSLSSITMAAGQWTGAVTVPNWEFSGARFIASYGGVTSQSSAFNVTAPRLSTISWPASELVYSPLTERIYMNAASTGYLTPLNPFQMTIGNDSVNIGSLGGKMVISDSGEYIYLDRGGGYISRFNVASNTADLYWSCGAPQIEDMAAVPNWPSAVAVARMDTSTSPRTRGTVIFNNNTALPNGGGGNVIEFVSPTRAYIYNNETTGFDFRRYNVNSNGLNFESSIGLLSGFGVNFSCRAGLVFASSGQIADGERGIQIGGSPSGMMIAGSATEGRYYSVTSTSLTAWDLHTLLPVGTMSYSAVGTPTGNLIRWSTNGLAFRTTSSLVAILRTGLVPQGGPTDLQLTIANADPSANVGSNYLCTFVISNAGPNIATNVVFSQTVPAIATVVLVSSPGSATATVAGGFTCTIPSIAPGAATLVSVTLRPAKSGVMGWRVGVTSGTADPDLTNNRLSISTAITSVTAYDSITEFALPANDLVWDAVHGTICASVPNANWLLGNSIVTFDPLTGAYPSLIATATEPNKLAIADNGQYLYASLGSEASIQRVNLVTRVADLKFPTGYNGVNDMEVMPGHAEVLAATV